MLENELLVLGNKIPCLTVKGRLRVYVHKLGAIVKRSIGSHLSVCKVNVFKLGTIVNAEITKGYTARKAYFFKGFTVTESA